VIGDSIHDLQMAKNANVSSLAATYGAHNQKTLSDYNPIGYAESADMIFDWIRKNG
jgi:phosphoglycolate phosphatase